MCCMDEACLAYFVKRMGGQGIGLEADLLVALVLNVWNSLEVDPEEVDLLVELTVMVVFHCLR